MLLESPTSKRTRPHGEVVAAGSGSGSSPSPFLNAMQAPGAGGQLNAPQPQPLLPPPPQRFDPQTGEHLFTMEQVRDIVRRACEEKERTLRDQYDRVLQQKLNEQYMSFAKFNEDYISRSLKPNDLSYCS